MKTLSNKEWEKVDFLIGFYNQIVRMVSNPQEEQDYNTGDSSVFAIGYVIDYVNKEGVGKVKISDITLSSDKLSDFRKNLKVIAERVKENIKLDYTKEWENLLQNYTIFEEVYSITSFAEVVE